MLLIQVRSGIGNYRHSLSLLCGRLRLGEGGREGDVGLRHQIDETREAESYKFGDGGTLVSSTRVTR